MTSSSLPLSEVAAVVRGVSFDKSEALDTPQDGYLPILRAGNIEAELLLDHDLVWVPATRVATDQRMRPGDIAICMSSGSQAVVGKTAPLRREWNGSVGAFCALVRPHETRVLPDFLSYFLKSEAFRTWTRKSTGANIKNIRKGELEAFPVPTPALDEQRRIVDLLSRAEGIVRMRREAQAKAQAIIPALFLDMFGDPVTNPKSLKVVAVGDLLAIPIRNGISPSRSGCHKGRVLTLSAITGGSFDQSAVKDATFAGPLVPADQVSAQDFLVCRGNGNKDLVGVGCFPHDNMPGVAFPDTAIAVRPKPDLVLPRFLAVQWQSQWVRQQIDLIAKTTNGTFKINQSGLSGIRLILPALSAQSAFEGRIRIIDSVLRQQADAFKKAEATFQALLARTFGGDLTAAVPSEEVAVA